MSNRDLIARAQELQRESGRIGLEFLRTDLETALTFATRALDANDPETRRRNQENARHAYDAVSRILGELKAQSVNEDERSDLENRLLLLKQKLTELGEGFD